MSKSTSVGGVERYRYLVVGGGVAASAAAEAIYNRDPGGSVLVVGREVSRPYHRPPLSKTYLRGEIDRPDLIAQPMGWFPEHDVDLRTGRRVTQLDPGRRRATLDDGRVVQYEQCVLAYGMTVAPLEVPGAGLPGLHYLRTVEDADQLKQRAARAVAEGRGRACVVGGGLLGAEVAASLTRRGVAVDWLIGDDLPWQSSAGEAVGRFVLGLLEKHGVACHRGRTAAELLGDGRVQRVRLDDESELPCDFAVACVGARVDSRPVAGTRVTLGRAILCDEFGRTDAEAVWAAGDCCLLLDRRFGKRLPCGHWDVARLQGGHVGRNAALAATGGEPAAWDAVPGWHSEVFGVDLFSWGTPLVAERRTVRGSVNVDRPAFAEVAFDADGRVCQATVVGRDGERGALRELVRARVPAAEVEARLRDSDSPLHR